MVHDFVGSGNGGGWGIALINFTQSSTMELFVSDTILVNNNNPGTGAGIIVRPTAKNEGRNLVIDQRLGDASTMPEFARQLVALKPDAILAVGPEALRAAREATSAVPIVIFGPDPLELGYASNLAHPGGNVTGVVIVAAELDGKRLENLHETVPSARRVAALLVPPSRDREMLAAATNAGVELRIYLLCSQEYARRERKRS